MPATTVRTVDLKRVHKGLYTAAAAPSLVDAPELPYLMIDRAGDPNGAAFRAGVAALYQVAYALRAALKQPPTATAYTVPSLQGYWWAVAGDDQRPATSRADWRSTMMLLQPPEVTPELLTAAVAAVTRRAPGGPVADVRLEHLPAATYAQALHVGPFSDEIHTMKRLHAFMRQHGRTWDRAHHEVYRSDPHRTAPEKLRTIIRYQLT